MEKELLELKAKLVQKILIVTTKFGAMKPEGRNNFSNYDYISSEQMLSGNRVYFPSVKLCIIPEVIESMEKVTINEKKKQVIRTVVKMVFEIVDTETGYSISKNWQGADQDTGGKSFGQAVTESCKRFYMKLFNISSNEIDPDSKTDEVVNGNGDVDIYATELANAVVQEEGEIIRDFQRRQIKWLMNEKLKIGITEFREKVCDISSDDFIITKDTMLIKQIRDSLYNKWALNLPYKKIEVSNEKQ